MTPSALHPINQEDIEAAVQAIKYGGDAKTITKVIPGILEQPSPAAAHELVCAASPNRNAWLPEALMLFNTPGLSPIQLREMTAAVFFPVAALETSEADTLARCSAQLGTYGFSFPKWRYLTQGVNGVSMIEHYGMHRLRRETDVRDPALRDPDRDLFGAGFILNENSWYIEYRRAYLVCANLSAENPVTLIIRNNSYFYGRDRLPVPVLISWAATSPDELENLSPSDFSNDRRFVKWQDIANVIPELPLSEKISRIENAVNFLSNFDRQLMAWVFEPDGGLPHLSDFLKSRSAAGAPPIFMSEADPAMPPWFPQSVLPVTPELLDELSNQNPPGALILLTGQNGDLPIRPAGNQTPPPAPTSIAL